MSPCFHHNLVYNRTPWLESHFSKEGFLKVPPFVICFEFCTDIRIIFLHEYNLGNNSPKASRWTIDKFWAGDFPRKMKDPKVGAKRYSEIWWNELHCFCKGTCYQNGTWPYCDFFLKLSWWKKNGFVDASRTKLDRLNGRINCKIKWIKI